MITNVDTSNFNNVQNSYRIARKESPRNDKYNDNEKYIGLNLKTVKKTLPTYHQLRT